MKRSLEKQKQKDKGQNSTANDKEEKKGDHSNKGVFWKQKLAAHEYSSDSNSEQSSDDEGLDLERFTQMAGTWRRTFGQKEIPVEPKPDVENDNQPGKKPKYSAGNRFMLKDNSSTDDIKRKRGKDQERYDNKKGGSTKGWKRFKRDE